MGFPWRLSLAAATVVSPQPGSTHIIRTACWPRQNFTSPQRPRILAVGTFSGLSFVQSSDQVGKDGGIFFSFLFLIKPLLQYTNLKTKTKKQKGGKSKAKQSRAKQSVTIKSSTGRVCPPALFHFCSNFRSDFALKTSVRHGIVAVRGQRAPLALHRHVEAYVRTYHSLALAKARLVSTFLTDLFWLIDGLI